MNLGAYLPSAKFTLLVASIALAGGSVWAAEYYTAPQAPATVSVANSPSQDPAWASALYQVMAQTDLPTQAADPNATKALLAAAAADGNVTDTVGRTLLVNLSSAKSQGLGDDTPTQNSLIAAALAQVKQNEASTTSYSLSDLTTVPPTKDALHAYGNAVMTAQGHYPQASQQATFQAMASLVNNGDESGLLSLPTIGEAYGAMAQELLAIPVPQTLAPFHLQVVNDYFKIAASYKDMTAMASDPLRGLAGFQNYQTLMQAEASMFTNIAQQLSKGGILFNKDEPGSAWSAFVSPT